MVSVVVDEELVVAEVRVEQVHGVLPVLHGRPVVAVRVEELDDARGRVKGGEVVASPAADLGCGGGGTEDGDDG